MAKEDAQGQSGAPGQHIVDQINSVSNIIGTLVPTVGAIGSMVRLIATAVRPTDAQKAQAFDAAIADFDGQLSKLNTEIAGFEDAKKAATAAKSAGSSEG